MRSRPNASTRASKSSNTASLAAPHDALAAPALAAPADPAALFAATTLFFWLVALLVDRRWGSPVALAGVGLLSAGILLAGISGLPVFLNDPTYPHDGVITLAHCTAPRKLDGKSAEPALIMTHFESDYGAAPKVEMKIGQKVTNLSIITQGVTRVVRDIFIAGATLDKAIAKALKCDAAAADTVKKSRTMLVSDEEKNAVSHRGKAGARIAAVEAVVYRQAVHHRGATPTLAGVPRRAFDTLKQRLSQEGLLYEDYLDSCLAQG